VVFYQNKLLGAVNFVDIDLGNSSCSFGLFANPEVNLPGTGRILEQVCIEYVFNHLMLSTMNLVVMTGNKQVINLHKKFGFNILCKKEIRGYEMLIMQKIKEGVE
jgi:UDP-4-amino-4,6-dideoxy-N-acetyl-beta-L-altrosamine N-acetyltransferase